MPWVTFRREFCHFWFSLNVFVCQQISWEKRGKFEIWICRMFWSQTFDCWNRFFWNSHQKSLRHYSWVLLYSWVNSFIQFRDNLHLILVKSLEQVFQNHRILQNSSRSNFHRGILITFLKTVYLLLIFTHFYSKLVFGRCLMNF